MENNEIPYFIKVRGCINCDSYKELKKRNEQFDHELQTGCLLKGCYDYGFSLINLFIDPEEIICKVKEGKFNPKQIENAKTYCLKINQKFGNFYIRRGISLDHLINSLLIKSNQ